MISYSWILLLTSSLSSTTTIQKIPNGPISYDIQNNDTNHLEWWQTEVIYQIYPRSFKDSNSDGIGDLRGIREKLNYIKSIGFGAIWLSPVYASPMVDFGYDISNYRKICPIFGTMEDFDMLLSAAHRLGIKVLMDFVPNHTSDKHDWFLKSIKKISPYVDYYVWKDARYNNRKRYPPNNWISAFGKSAWEWNEERKQYYLHQFSIGQPDLNYRNPVVYEEMKNVITFWLDKGVDGFRVDAINFVYENVNFPDEPRSNLPFVNEDETRYLRHIYTQNQLENIDLVKDWRKLLDEYSKPGREIFMMTEAYSDEINDVMNFYGNTTHPGAHFPFNFLLIVNVDAESNASAVRDQIKLWYHRMPNGKWSNWVLGNHDNFRPATRFGNLLIDGLHMVQMLLPGTPIIYNGDELGMEDTFIRWDQTVDPVALNAGPLRYKMFSRDPARSPFQWDSSENAGFTQSLHSWLPVNPNYWQINVENQLRLSKISHSMSHLEIFKLLIRLRKSVVFLKGDLNIYVLSEWVLAVSRSYMDHASYIIVINLGSEMTTSNLRSQRPSLPPKMKVLIPSVNSNILIGQTVETAAIKLRPKASVLLTTTDEKWGVKDSEDTKIEVKHFMV